MIILVSTANQTTKLEEYCESIDRALEGNFPLSATIGSIIRLAYVLNEAGFDVCLSTNTDISCSKFPCIKHENVDHNNFDYLIVHQSHWNGHSLTFGNKALEKTVLWLHLYSNFALVYTFLKFGGYYVVCPSIDCAKFFRTVPQWHQKVGVVYNSYDSNLYNYSCEISEKKLLFIGAISSGKGFLELMDIWSYLASNQVDLELCIAGSIHLHKPKIELGDMGVADKKFESNYIKPWMESLPKDYQPNFLGGLTPKELQQVINQSWAVIVNPSWYAKETFCVSAVEAQACNKTVFSVATGGLQETVYRGNFKSLANDKKPEALGKLILDGLSNMETVSKNGQLAGDFVRSKFSLSVICESWRRLLSEQKSEPSLPKSWQTPKDFFSDLMRWSRTGVSYYYWRSPLDRRMLKEMGKYQK